MSKRRSLVAAAITAKAAGDLLDLSRFDRAAVCPDWSSIDDQIAWLEIEKVNAPPIVPSTPAAGH